MAKGKSSVGFWLLIGTLVVGGGVGIYFLLREPKDETTDDNLDEKKDDTNIPIIKDDSRSGGGSGSVTKPKISAPSELNTADKIKAFQNYVLNVKNDVSILGGSGADGKWGTNSQKAWDKYGTGFKQSPTFKGFTTVVSQDAKERIIAFAKGSDKATSKFLNNANQDFVKKWAETIGKERTAFIWAEQVYRTKTGERVMDYNPLKFNLKTSKVATLRASASKDSAGTGIKAGEELGKGGDIKFNNQNLYIYLPNKKKWIASINVKKASSSFTGGEEEIWAGFDDNFDITFK
jgi:hypothetical protein